MRRILRIGAALIVAASAPFLASPVAARSDAAACIARPFAVYFEAKSSKLTKQGAAVLDAVADAYAACDDVEVTLSGHTDRRGSDAANVKLSQKMTKTVFDFLAAKGVPKGVMTVQAFGESRPMIETADGVSEPQNRRVEIYFGPATGW